MKVILVVAFFSTFQTILSDTITFTEKDFVFNEYRARFKDLKINDLEKAKENVYKTWKEVKLQNERFARGESKFKADLNHFSWKDLARLKKEKVGEMPKLPKAITLSDAVNTTDFDKTSEIINNRAARSSIPQNFNWSKTGNVPAVQYQRECGCGYVFAAFDAIEFVRRIKGLYGSLSKQDALECTNGCHGGKAEWVFKFFIKNGAALESDYPYEGKMKHPYCSPEKRERIKLSLNYDEGWFNVVDFHKSSLEFVIQYHVKKFGPVTVAFEVYTNLYHYKSGIYDQVMGEYHGTHVGLLVGWGDDEATKEKYWIVKNSWGKRWGENGYIKIPRGIDFCKIESTEIMSFNVQTDMQ